MQLDRTDTVGLTTAGGAPSEAITQLADGATSGLSIGRYILLDRLGEGGMGTVYSAFDPELERSVALKVVRADRRHSESARMLLAREAKIAARLSHPNLVPIFDAGAVGDLLFFAMERIEGRNLAQVLEEDDLTWRQVLELFLAAGDGLRAAHAEGLVHHDFKPGNVLVANDGRVLVADFGLARLATGSDETEGDRGPLGTRASPLGTPAYASPEQLRRETTDPRTDQFSFCASLYEALYGQLPCPDRSKIEHGPAQLPEDSPVPAWVRQPLLRGLSADPANRYEELGELLQALRKDPRRRMRQVLAAGILGGLICLTGWAAYRTGEIRAVTCDGAERKLAGIWDAQRRSDLRTAVLSTHLPLAASAWNAIEPRFDEYASRWTRAHVEACESAHQGLQTDHVASLQIACLENRLLDFDAAVSLLAKADPEVLRSAGVITQLPALAGCRDSDVLTHLEQPPADAAVAEEISLVRQQIALMRARINAGQMRLVIEDANALVQQADALHYRPLSAEVRLVSSAAKGFSGHLGAAYEGFAEAAGMALAGRDDETLAEALRSLMIVARVSGDQHAALMWTELSGAAVTRLNDRPDLRADHEFALGMVRSMQGKYEEAIAHFENFLTHRIDTTNRPSQAHHNIARALAKLGRLEEATEALDRSLASLQRDLGEMHPSLIPTLEMSSGIRRRQGDHEGALELIERAIAIQTAQGAEYHLAESLQVIRAEILLELGRAEEALEPMESKLADLERQQSEGEKVNPVQFATVRFLLAQAIAGAREAQRQRATHLANQAMETFRGAGKAHEDDAFAVETWLAVQAARNEPGT